MAKSGLFLVMEMLSGLAAGGALLLVFLRFLYLLRRLWLYVGFGSGRQLEEEASQPASLKPIKLKLIINKYTKQVIFAECDEHFVDLLLSFLTLPMGTIVRIADKKSGIGSMDELYKSVEALDKKSFRKRACKTMLLEPRSAYGLLCNNLIVKVDQTDYTKFFTCSKTPCLNDESFGFVSFVRNSICACGKAMDNKLRIKYAGFLDIGSGFVTRVERFIISDDFQILPASISNTRTLLLRQDIADNNGVQEWNVNVGLEEVLKLLHHSTLSTKPLTDVFLPKDGKFEIIPSPVSLHAPHQYQTNQNSSSEGMKAKLWFSKSTNRVICLEAKEDFIDFLFSFLTFPLGSMVKLLKGNSSLGSIDNLYKSAESLSAMDIISARSKEMILNPKLERMFSCDNQLLEVLEEALPTEFKYNKCYSCCLQKKTCQHIQYQRLKIMNPKCPGQTSSGGGFIKQQGSLLVTDDLLVEPLSPASGMSRLDIPFSDLEELQITVGQEEALAILKAALVSKRVLSHAFSSKVINRNFFAL